MPIRRSSVFTAAIAALAASALLAGCGSSPNDPNKKAADTGKASGVLNVGMPNGPQTNNNNPFLGTSAGANLGYRYMIYEPLAMVNTVKPADTAKPWLATKFEWSDNYTKLVLTIRDGVKFSDDTPLTGDDVAYTFQLLKDKAALNSNALPIGDVTASGQTVTIGFTASQFVTQAKVLSTLIVPKAIWSKMADPTTDVVANPIGTGPYTMKSFTPQNVTLSIRTSYWQDLPKVAELRYTSYTGNDAQTTALTSGASEWSYVFIPNAKTVFAGKDPEHFKLWFPPNLSADGLWLNTTVKPFDNAALRKAMSMVINREDIFVQASSGYFKPKVDSITGLPTPVGDTFITDAYKGKVQAVDVEGAKKVLTEAGFTLDGGTLKDPTGKPVTIKLSDPAGWSDYQTTLTIIADNISQIGIKSTIDKANQDAWIKDIGTGNFEGAMHWTNGGATPYDFYQNIMDGATLQPIGTDSPAGNFGRFNNPDATKALKDYANAADEASRTTALAALQKIMVEQVPMIATSAGNFGAEYSTKNWVGWPDDKSPYAGAQPTTGGALNIILHLKPAN